MHKQRRGIIFAIMMSARAAATSAFISKIPRIMITKPRCTSCDIRSTGWSVLPTSYYEWCTSSLSRSRTIERPAHLLATTAQEGSEVVNQPAETVSYNLQPQIFIDEVTSFLEADAIPYRSTSQAEIERMLEKYFEPRSNSDKVNEIMTLLEDHKIFAVGTGNAKQLNNTDAIDLPTSQQPYSFLLHLCPTPKLKELQITYQRHQPDASITQAVASHSWMNTHLTNALRNHVSSIPMVHLHQDVWNRSSNICKSRIRSKCGRHDYRIYGRQTIVKRIPKSDYLPFLEQNHLWGGTGAKYGYGLYRKPNKKEQKDGNPVTDSTKQTDIDEEPKLVAVATFSSKRKVTRASLKFHSFELLRFCTRSDTTVVGGLTKLVSAFVKDRKDNNSNNARRQQQSKNRRNQKHYLNATKYGTGGGEEEPVEIDLITSIDRDFGCNTWPNFEQMEVMDPIPMFVGDVDGIRRHAVGAGLTSLDHQTGSTDGGGSMSTSTMLRSGLPGSLMQQLDSESHSEDKNPFSVAAENGFHPVFDCGVERLMLVIESEKTKNDNAALSPSELWEESEPRYVKEHYSSNAGVANMLSCVRHARKQ